MTGTTSANWTQLNVGSTTGHTLGTAGTTAYYCVDESLTFSNSTPGDSGLVILGTVYLYLPQGVTITCTGADADGTTGVGAGIGTRGGAGGNGGRAPAKEDYYKRFCVILYGVSIIYDDIPTQSYAELFFLILSNFFPTSYQHSCVPAVGVSIKRQRCTCGEPMAFPAHEAGFPRVHTHTVCYFLRANRS